MSLEIDHIDGNPKNQDPDNICLLCHRCNNRMKLLKPSEKSRLISYKRLQHVCVCENGQDHSPTSLVKETIDYNSGSLEMKANQIFEKDFREWLLSNIQKFGSYSKQEAINSGAERFGCSPATTRRYIDKLTSNEGVFDIQENSLHQRVLVCKPCLLKDMVRVDVLIQGLEKEIQKRNQGVKHAL